MAENDEQVIEKDVKEVIDKISEQSVEASVTSPKNNDGPIDPSKLGILNDVSIVLTIEIGRAQIKIKDLLNLTKDSIIDLNKLAGEPVDIYANGKLISKGNIITANGKYCVRLTSIPDKS